MVHVKNPYLHNVHVCDVKYILKKFQHMFLTIEKYNTLKIRPFIFWQTYKDELNFISFSSILLCSCKLLLRHLLHFLDNPTSTNFHSKSQISNNLVNPTFDTSLPSTTSFAQEHKLMQLVVKKFPLLFIICKITNAQIASSNQKNMSFKPQKNTKHSQPKFFGTRSMVWSPNVYM